MFYPKLKSLKTEVSAQKVFGGYRHTKSAGENSFYDMKNLWSGNFPLLSTRNFRGTWKGRRFVGDVAQEFGYISLTGKTVTAAAAVGGKIVLCGGDTVFADGVNIGGIELDDSVSKRTIVPCGRNFLVVPDGEYVKLDGAVRKVVHCKKTFIPTQSALLTYAFSDGTDIIPTYKGSFSDSAAPGESAVIFSENSMALYTYNGASWDFTADLYVKISFTKSIGGFYEKETVYYTSAEKRIKDGRYLLENVIANTVILKGVLRESGSSNGISIKKIFPELDFAVEHNNRIWGCRYGENENGEFVNEIYASALGDPTRFYTFEGISTDSYCAALGCSGEFTGAVALGNEILFFKEDYIIRVTGSTPSDFSVYAFPARGVEKGAHLSIVNLNEKVFYKSRGGIMVYDGTFPENISADLGEDGFWDVCAGGVRGKYYIAMNNSEGQRHIYVYDTSLSLWHKEDCEDNVRLMLSLDGCLYYICLISTVTVGGIEHYTYSFMLADITHASDAVNLFKDSGNGYDYEYEKESSFSWFAESGVIGANKTPERQIVRRLFLTLSLEPSSAFSVYIAPDNSDTFIKLCDIVSPFDGVFTVPVSTVPCHTFRLRFSGTGSFTLYSITKKTEITSEVRNLG